MITKGYIYKIICNLDKSICYIGSTFRTLNKRFEEHKKNYKNNNGTFSIYHYFDKYGIDNFKIELIKSYNVIRIYPSDHKHLYAYETLWINNIKNCINKQLPFNPLWNILKNEYHKEYYQDNKKELVEKHKEYNENHKEEIAEYKKQHYEKNKKEIAEKKKEYYQKNKQEIAEKRKQQKFTCECGSTVRLSDKSQHFKTTRHIQFLENK